MLKLVKSILPFIKPFWKKILFFAFCSLPLAAIKSYQAYFIKDVFDNGLSPDATFNEALRLAAILIGLQTINYPFRYWHFYGMRYAMDRVIVSIRQSLFKKFQKLPMDFFSQNRQGDLISRAINDSHLVALGFKHTVDLIREPLTAIGLLGVAVYHSWKLTLIILAVTPLFILVFNKTGKLVHFYAGKVQEFVAEITHRLSEGLEGQKVVKAFSLQNYAVKRFDEVQGDFFSYQKKNSSVEEHSHPLVESIGSIAFGGVIIFAHHLITSGEMTTGSFISFVAALAMFMDPVRKFTHANVRVNQGVSAAQRYFEVMEFPEEEDQGTIELKGFDHEIIFKNVSFSYGETQVLNNVSFTLKKGQTMGLVGLSGSGKSTIVSLLMRFYNIDSGEILIDGHPIKDIKLASLRSLFGFVAQDIFLFNDTILENLKVGNNYSDDEIEKALTVSYAKEFINTLPDGLNTVVGDRGMKLSGGQKQRLTIARAFLHNCPIMLFDEATSALDNESEKIVQAAMDRVAGEKTVIAVAHRLSTIQNYDIIIVLKEGRKVEQGTHRELMGNGAEYFKLYELSQRGENPIFFDK